MNAFKVRRRLAAILVGAACAGVAFGLVSAASGTGGSAPTATVSTTTGEIVWT